MHGAGTMSAKRTRIAVGLVSGAALLVTILGCRASATAPPRPAATGAYCRLTVTESEGCGDADVEALIAPARPRIEECRGARGGKLRVRVQRTAAGKLAFHVEPGSSLDPRERQCVLDALSTVEAAENKTAWTGGANVPPTGFTSHIVIEW